MKKFTICLAAVLVIVLTGIVIAEEANNNYQPPTPITFNYPVYVPAEKLINLQNKVQNYIEWGICILPDSIPSIAEVSLDTRHPEKKTLVQTMKCSVPFHFLP